MRASVHTVAAGRAGGGGSGQLGFGGELGRGRGREALSVQRAARSAAGGGADHNRAGARGGGAASGAVEAAAVAATGRVMLAWDLDNITPRGTRL